MSVSLLLSLELGSRGVGSMMQNQSSIKGVQHENEEKGVVFQDSGNFLGCFRTTCSDFIFSIILPSRSRQAPFSVHRQMSEFLSSDRQTPEAHCKQHDLAPPQQPPLSTLIFPSASLNIRQTLSALSARTLSIRNRLHSIDSDAQFLQDVAVAYPECVVIANERCGGWYVEGGMKGRSFRGLSEGERCGVKERDGGTAMEVEGARRKARGSAYFKSTDGHAGEWNFSLRRLNLQVLEAVGVYGG